MVIGQYSSVKQFFPSLSSLCVAPVATSRGTRKGALASLRLGGTLREAEASTLKN